MPYSDYFDDYYTLHDEDGNIINEPEDTLICPTTEEECEFCDMCRGNNV